MLNETLEGFMKWVGAAAWTAILGGGFLALVGIFGTVIGVLTGAGQIFLGIRLLDARYHAERLRGLPGNDEEELIALLRSMTVYFMVSVIMTILSLALNMATLNVVRG
jgi:ABC-type glycerol-3-phosphate transport system permease component